MSRHLSRGGHAGSGPDRGAHSAPDPGLDSGPELAAVLDDLAAEYEVDRDHVLGRLRAEGAGRTRVAGRAPAGRTLTALRRSGPLLSAAAVASVLVGVALGLHTDPDPDVASSPAPATSHAVSTTPTATVSTPTATPTPSGTGSVTGTVTGSVPGTPTGRGNLPASGTGAPSRPGTGSSSTTAAHTTPPAPGSAEDPATIQVAGYGSRVVLGSGSGADWLVTGARSDATVIRLKRGSGALGVSVLAGQASVQRAPFLLDWSAGAPEQDHVGAHTWWCADNGGAQDDAVFRVRVAALPAGASLVVVTGVARDAGAQSVKIEARVDGGRLAQLRTGGGRVTITPPAAAAGRGMTVEFTPSPGGLPAGKVCLAAAVLG